jgi:hypothetical protein
MTGFRIILVLAFVAGLSILSSASAVAQEPVNPMSGRVDSLLSLAEQAYTERSGPEGTNWFRQMEERQEDLLAALQWLIDADEQEKALRLAARLGYFWDGGFVEGGLDWLERVLSLPRAQAPTPDRVLALTRSGTLAFRLRQQEVAHARTREALTLARQLEDTDMIAFALTALARIALRDEDHDSVSRHATEAMAIYLNELDDPEGAAYARHMLAYSASMQSAWRRSAELYEENLRVFGEAANLYMVAVETGNLAGVEIRAGNLARGKELSREYLKLVIELEDELSLAYAILGFGQLAAEDHAYERAVQFLAASEAVLKGLGTTWDPGAEKDFVLYRERAISALSKADFEAAWERGRTMQRDEVIALALEY